MFLRIRIALAFLTILPIRLPDDLEESDLSGSAAFFPVAGWIIGILLAGAAWFASRFALPVLPAAVLIVAMEAWFTRGLHLDGLADLMDGLGGGNTPDKRLAIMKDSATGAFGVVGLICLLLLKVGCIREILALPTCPEKYLLVACVPALSRWAMVTLAYKSKYPRQTGTGHPFVGKVVFNSIIIGTVLCLPALSLQGLGLVVWVAVLLPHVWLRFNATQALGGITGDVLGAACELGEAAGWLAAVFFI